MASWRSGGPGPRNVQQVVVALPAPAFLTPGQYWLEFCFNGLNFVPPITATGVVNTGDARQFLNTTGTYAPILNGTVATAGIPFEFEGPFGMAGSITNLGGGCSGALTLRVVGAPTVGGFFRAQLSPVGPLNAIIVGFSDPNLPLPLCACVQHSSLDFIDIGTGSFELQIPRASASLSGAQIFTQGAELFSGPCPIPFPLGLTDGFRVTLNTN